MSWESTAHYYRVLNETVRERVGGLHSAPLLIHSVDFAEIVRFQNSGDWAGAAEVLGRAGRGLADAGAQFLVMSTNTMHVVADEIEAAAGIPLLHIGAPTADAVLAARIGTVGLLGTRFTMELDFYRERLERRGLTVLTPDADDRALVDRIIFEELVLGVTTHRSREAYRRGHRSTGREWRRRGDSRMHRDHDAGGSRGFSRAGLRYHRPPRSGGRRIVYALSNPTHVNRRHQLPGVATRR
jgi:aspartate racemase